MTDACRPHSRRIFHPAFSPARFAPKSASNVHWRRVLTSPTEIRRSYLDHFAREGNQLVPSAPLVTPTNPTLMFVTSGMVTLDKRREGNVLVVIFNLERLSI